MVTRPCYPGGGKEDTMTDHLNGNQNIFDAGHPDMIDLHWEAVCHHGHTVMFDESSPFAFSLTERVRSLTPEPSTVEWGEAGFQVEELEPFPCDRNEFLDKIPLNE
jgi:hypothetical protein